MKPYLVGVWTLVLSNGTAGTGYFNKDRQKRFYLPSRSVIFSWSLYFRYKIIQALWAVDKGLTIK